jgi:hypothetical protein
MTKGVWIDWHGGKCPLPDGTEHEVRFRNGIEVRDRHPEGWRWSDWNNEADIIAYRVVRSS